MLVHTCVADCAWNVGVYATGGGGGGASFLDSPGEIKRREVSWTLTKKLNFHLQVQVRSRGGRWAGPSGEPRRDQLGSES